MPHLKSSGGLPWHYQREGAGKSLVFLHGWSVNLRVWRQQVKHFSTGYNVISIDLPGHGETPWQEMSLEQMAVDVLALLRTFSLEKINVVGSSLGGLLGLKMFSLEPSLFARMTLVGSQPKFCQSVDYPFGLEKERIQKLMRRLDEEYPAVVHIFFRSLFTKEERAGRRFKWLQTFRKTDSVPGKEALQKMLMILEREDLRETLKGLSIPLQFIGGTDDYICPRDLCGYFKDVCPGTRFDLFARCGHFPFLSQPHEFNQALEAFLQERNSSLKEGKEGLCC